MYYLGKVQTFVTTAKHIVVLLNDAPRNMTCVWLNVINTSFSDMESDWTHWPSNL